MCTRGSDIRLDWHYMWCPTGHQSRPSCLPGDGEWCRPWLPVSLEICRRYHYRRVPPEQSTSTLPQAMNGICTQVSDDHMTLSINKCALLQVSFGRDPLPPLDISAGQHVTTVTSMTLLDVMNLAPFSQMEHPHSSDDHESQHQEVLSGHPKMCWNHHHTLSQVLRDIHPARSWVCCRRVAPRYHADPLRQYRTGPRCLTAYHLPWATLWACLEQHWTSYPTHIAVNSAVRVLPTLSLPVRGECGQDRVSVHRL